ncbi:MULTISPECIES: cell wall metabolism sensor histidine kinase WalK [Planococcus]|uniref:histidine kinase n=1 Tax=Planococcus citreus TaxID=1373 RepID=A0A497YT22_9BACL|nr:MULTISPECIES: cell wall metabolism sensor histidine kinase WalK [Planococcus]AUD15231.1 cell wall metabolism sensor histidine kinase WalK [Planococcus sp. MB-3u-03]PKG46367.1 cell wall metabolism sensor histidine kinase WalK [Planococcus sp. Urea-trap-24]PKG90153.1 cell wall metabolism sensor histidine kinase WalK [Planococcus sp. Urea-3u-39]PKH39489.1 cell wall metabolism sensor histidine kinase WalK [Planococcus sp. MB-3u-09]RLJ91483.1 PAS/PAC sensor signal transduction histidine kinase [
MLKTSFFKSIHVKFVLIYILLILLAMQIIGLYFSEQLEGTLRGNFEDSIRDRMEIIEFSVREEMIRNRTDEDLTIEQSLRSVLTNFDSGDIDEIRVVDNRYRILGTSTGENQSLVGQRSTDDQIRRSIIGETLLEQTYIDDNREERVWVRTLPITAVGGEMLGTLYVKAEVENVYDQMDTINSILAGGTAIALVITAVLGVLVAQTISRPIADMRKQAQAMAKGNFSRKVRVYSEDEIGQLARAFNHLTNRLQESQQSTESERRKLASVLANMTDGVLSTDRRGRIILINEPALQLLNVSRETVINRPVTTVLGLDESYTFEDLIDMRDAITLDISSQDQATLLRTTFSVIQKETGFVNGLIAVLHDNTEQEKIDMERREFVANVSHELRTPLTTMRSYLEALADGAWQDPDLAPNFLNVTQTETERMIRLVNDLLKLSKMDSSEADLSREMVEFGVFFNRIIDRFEMSKSQNVSFERKVPKSQYFVEIDTDKLTQVIDNIISNALKYSPEGGKVRFSVREKEGELLVSISDEGMGIPKENVERIFDRFYRVDRARSRAMGGTGLGLAISKEMINAHGGRIWAQSKYGKGTSIYFTLPYEIDDGGEWD